MSLTELEGTLHGLGSPATGERVRVRIEGHGLTIAYADGRSRGVPYANLRSRVGGWHGQSLLLEWEEHGEPATLALNDEAALARLARGGDAELPSALQPHLREWKRAQGRHTWQRRGALTAGVLIAVALVALAVTLIFRAGRLADLAVTRIPVVVEQQIGELALQQVLLGARELPPGPATVAVDTIMGRLLPHVAGPYTFRWKLIENDQINAFAVPGGGIVIFSGLLKQADSADEVAGVLAHEIQHVVQRHSLRAMVQGLGLAAVAQIAVGGGSELAGQLAGVAQQLGRLRFSREQEAQADEEGVALLQLAGVRTDGIVTFFHKLERKGGATVPTLLSTHPNSGKRAARLAQLVAAAPAPAALPLDWDAVRASLPDSP